MLARPRRAIGAVVVALGSLLLLGAHGPVLAQEADPAGAVHVVVVDGEIDLGLASLLERAVREAQEDDAAALVVRVDTPGGRLDAVLRMRDALLAAEVPTVAFVDRDAFSAGALVAIASEQLWVAPGAVIGAATPVLGDGSSADEKTLSAVRAVFRATATERGRDPLVAEAMVDPAIVVEGLVARGELVTLDVAQAQERGYADGLADDLTGLLAALGLEDAPAWTSCRRSPSGSSGCSRAASWRGCCSASASGCSSVTCSGVAGSVSARRSGPRPSRPSSSGTCSRDWQASSRSS